MQGEIDVWRPLEEPPTHTSTYPDWNALLTERRKSTAISPATPQPEATCEQLPGKPAEASRTEGMPAAAPDAAAAVDAPAPAAAAPAAAVDAPAPAAAAAAPAAAMDAPAAAPAAAVDAAAAAPAAAVGAPAAAVDDAAAAPATVVAAAAAANRYNMCLFWVTCRLCNA